MCKYRGKIMEYIQQLVHQKQAFLETDNIISQKAIATHIFFSSQEGENIFQSKAYIPQYKIRNTHTSHNATLHNCLWFKIIQ